MPRKSTMQVLQITGVREFRFIEMPVPQPLGRQVLIRRFGIVTCNAYDQHIYNGQPYPDETSTVAFPYSPGGPGHEWVAVIEELGPETKDFSIGDWVCSPGGRGEHDPHPSGPGGYAPYSTIHETSLVRVPARMDIKKLAPLEMASCVAANFIDLKAMNVDIRGKRAGVMGLGPAGLIAAQMFRAEGATEVVGFDINERRRDYAVSSGQVDRAIDPTGEEGKALPIRDRLDPDAPIEIGIDCAGFAAALQYLMDHTRDVVTIFAVQHGPVQFMVRPPGVHQALKLIGYPYRSFACGDYAAERVADGSLDLSLLVTHVLRLEQYDQAIDLIEKQQALKVMFTFDERDW